MKKYLHLFTVEGLTPKQIGIKQERDPSYAYRMRRKLINGGWMNKFQDAVHNPEATPGLRGVNSAKVYWRPHANRYIISIIDGQENKRYRQKIGCIIPDKGFLITCHEKVLEITDKNSYTSEHREKADIKALESLTRILPRYESRLGLILVKDGYPNLKRTYQEIARVNDEAAIILEEVDKEERIVRVYHDVDGKLRFKIDYSHDFPEAEFVHPKTAGPDSGRYAHYVRDILEKESLKPSELTKVLLFHIQSQDRINQQLTEGIAGIAKAVEANTQQQTAMLKMLTPQRTTHQGKGERQWYHG